MTMQPHNGWQQAQPYPQSMSDRRTGNGGEVACAWVLTVFTLGYFLPWAIAASRGKSNSLAVALLNLFAGWTLIGWIIALVMACGGHQPMYAPITVVTQATVAAAATTPAGWYSDPHGLAQQRYWDGQVWTAHVHNG